MTHHITPTHAHNVENNMRKNEGKTNNQRLSEEERDRENEKKNSIYQFKTISIIFQFVFYVFFFVDAPFDCKRPFRLRTNCSKSRNATAQ